MRKSALAALAVCTLPLVLSGCGKDSDAARKQQLLIDRMEIADLLDNVYDNVETASTRDFDKYYIKDAIFDVNGTPYKGQQAILDYHRQVAKTSPHLKGSFHMLVDNLRVKVNGDTATATCYSRACFQKA